MSSLTKTTFVVKTNTAYLNKVNLDVQSKVKLVVNSDRPIDIYVRKADGTSLLELVEIKATERELTLDAGRYSFLYFRKKCLMPWKKPKVATQMEITPVVAGSFHQQMPPAPIMVVPAQLPVGFVPPTPTTPPARPPAVPLPVPAGVSNNNHVVGSQLQTQADANIAPSAVTSAFAQDPDNA
jgi:hypothetical protein